MESYSQGSVSDLEEAVNSSLNGEVGAEELPDIFSSYSDTAYAVQSRTSWQTFPCILQKMSCPGM